MLFSLKKRRWLYIVTLILLMFFSLTACGIHFHDWEAATCAEPKTCTDCGETEGERLAHIAKEDGTCKLCGRKCSLVLLDGKRHGAYSVVYDGVRLGMVIRSPGEEKLGCPCSYSIYDAEGTLTAEGVWSKEDLSLPLSEEKHSEAYYCAYTGFISLEPGDYTITYQYTKESSATLDSRAQIAYFKPLGTAVSSPYPMKITVK